MITVQQERSRFWLRLKLFLTLANASCTKLPASKPATKPQRRSHRTSAFFELP
jgi:hypothetical protein